MDREAEKILEEVTLAIKEQLELLGDSVHFERIKNGLYEAHEGIQFAKESLDGIHNEFMPEEEREYISDYLHEYHDGDYELKTYEMSDKELLDKYDSWTNYTGREEHSDRVERLRGIYNGMRLLKVVNE